MRINVYSQELTDEVAEITKESNTGRVYKAAQLILHSSDKLHHPPMDDDRSAVTFWLPKSKERRRKMAIAFRQIADIFDIALYSEKQIADARRMNAILKDEGYD